MGLACDLGRQAMTPEAPALLPLPCPFCNSLEVKTKADQMQGTKWGMAICQNCGAMGPEVRTEYEMAADAPWHREAIKEWNRRIAPPPTDEDVERVARAVLPWMDHADGTVSDDYVMPDARECARAAISAMHRP